MQVVILCGGRGSRLSEETEVRPKPMVEIGGRPILWHIMKLYSHHGFHEFVLCLGYRGDVIRDYFLNYFARNSDSRVHLAEDRIEYLSSFHEEKQWVVTLAETGDATPTGGRVKRVAKYLEGPRFLLTYGDGLSNVDVRQLVAFHERQGRLATVTGVRPVTRYGELQLDGERVESFHEKPQLVEGWVNGGYFVLERGVLDRLTDDSSIGGGPGAGGESDPLESLAADGQLSVYRHDDYWRAMDTLRDRISLEEEWATGRAGWKVW